MHPNRVKVYRERSGLKQEALAAQTDTRQSEISAIERGIREPGVYTALRIATALGTTVEGIFGKERE